ncbi:MAG: hypothetical protein WKF84_09205 [Pyrinomonadaceae bacterium]
MSTKLRVGPGQRCSDEASGASRRHAQRASGRERGSSAWRGTSSEALRCKKGEDGGGGGSMTGGAATARVAAACLLSEAGRRRRSLQMAATE